jgi:Stealth protein CR2, conserved region 2/Stealth protein CR1, conserved region 1/Stealth protein CR4, conserved region 4
MPSAKAFQKATNSEKIDIVYLWVDGNDPIWRQKRQNALRQLNANNRNSIAKYGNVEGRFRDNDELRYSLRALERYFPDCGHVYIVTDAQRPAWLQNSAHISIIDHTDLIPANKLPTFDSANIESYIHHIPNLSERYFYLNDDVFFGSPVVVSHWFSQDATLNGTQDSICVGWSDDLPVSNEGLQPDATALENACRLSIKWLQKNTNNPASYEHTYRTFAHSPRPMLKSMLFALETEAADLFESVRSTVFRAWDKPTIVSDFVLRWALANDQARVGDYSHIYLSTGDIKSNADLESFIAADGLLDFFCINDTTDDADNLDPRLAMVQTSLQTMFPIASRYELPVNDAATAAITSAYIASGNKPA